MTADLLRAFDLRSLMPFAVSDWEQTALSAMQVLVVSRRYRGPRPLTPEERARRILDPLTSTEKREQLEYLLDRQRQGTYADRTDLFHMVSLDGFAERFGSFDRLQYQAQLDAERDRLESEWDAARAVMDSGPLQHLVRVALTAPHNLLEGERDALRLHFEKALAGETLPQRHSQRVTSAEIPEGLPRGPGEWRSHSDFWRAVNRKPQATPSPLAGVGAAGSALSWGRGASRSHGRKPGHVIAAGTKRFESKQQIADERAMREARIRDVESLDLAALMQEVAS